MYVSKYEQGFFSVFKKSAVLFLQLALYFN